MKKSILITLGILILLLAGGIWIYLMLYGTPQNSAEIFGKLGLSGTNGIPQTESPVPTENPLDDSATLSALRQLTTRPVAGAVFLPDAIRYVERGTGHVYEIALPYGEEKLVSNTTIPQTVEAQFSKDGQKVIVTAQRNEVNESIVGTIVGNTDGGGMIAGVSLPSGVTNVGWGVDDVTVVYILPQDLGSSGHAYNPVSGTSTQLFQIPLRDVTVIWGKTIYVYTTPTAALTGYVYQIQKGQLTYLTEGAKGLMPVPYSGGIAITKSIDGVLTSETIGSSPVELTLDLIREKCVTHPMKTLHLYCAAPYREPEGVFPDDWYKGTYSFNDTLWLVNIEENSVTVLSNFLTESGREIDVSTIGTDASGTYIYFVNKNDGALWMFDTTKF